MLKCKIASLLFLAGCADPDLGSPDAGASLLEVKRVLVKAGDTDNAELVKKLPIARSQDSATRRVVMRLRPDDIPDLAPGDRLSAPAEVQVTTRCDVGQTAPGCDYNPKVAAQLILAGDPDDTHADGPGSVSLSPRAELSCTKAEHHCKFIFPVSAATRRLVDGADIPCVAEDSCTINLVMWAWDSHARAGQVDDVLVGENEGNYLDNGVVKGDKGRLMVVRERGIGDADRGERETSGSGTITIPTTIHPVVVYSHPLKADGAGLTRGEQFVVEGKVVTAVSSRARVSTQLIVSKSPSDTGGGIDHINPRSISEGNGINCTPGTSPCTSRKVSVFRVEADIAGPVYVNLVAVSAVPGGGSANVTVHRSDGYLRSTRYPAWLKN